MELRTSKCVNCGDEGYRDTYSFIDGKPYCDICAYKELEDFEDRIINDFMDDQS